MAKNTKKKNPGTQPKRTLAGVLLRGQLLDSDFFKRNWLVFAVIVVLALSYITNKYTCQTKMEEERRLTEELEIVRTERVRLRSLYMGRIRESSMQALVDSLHLGLSVLEHPPYKLPSLEKL